VAAELAKFQCSDLWLSGPTSLSPEVAAELTKFQGNLSLSSLTKVTPEVVEMAKKIFMSSKFLYLNSKTEKILIEYLMGEHAKTIKQYLESNNFPMEKINIEPLVNRLNIQLDLVARGYFLFNCFELAGDVAKFKIGNIEGDVAKGLDATTVTDKGGNEIKGVTLIEKLNKLYQLENTEASPEAQPEDLKKHVRDQLEIAHRDETSWQGAEKILKELLTLKGLNDIEGDIETKYSTGRWGSAEELVLNELYRLREDYVRTKIKELDLDLDGINFNNVREEDESRKDLAFEILSICKRKGVSPLDIGIDGIFTKGEDLDYSIINIDDDEYYTKWNKNKEILKRVGQAADNIREEIPENQKKQEEMLKYIESVIEMSSDLDVSWQEAEKKLLELKALIKKDPSLGRMWVYVYNSGANTVQSQIKMALWRLYWKYIESKAKERGYDFEGPDDGIIDAERPDRNKFVEKTLAICENEGTSPLEIDLDQFFNEFEKDKELRETLFDLTQKYNLKDLFIWDNEIYDTNEVEKSLPKIEEVLKKLSEEERKRIKYRIVIDSDGREGFLRTDEGKAVFSVDYNKSADEIADALKKIALQSKLDDELKQLSQETGLTIECWYDIAYDVEEVEIALPKINEVLNGLREDEKKVLKKYKIMIDYGDAKGRKIGARKSNEGETVIAIDYTQSAQEITDTLKKAAKSLGL
jgi:hypothetical protein